MSSESKKSECESCRDALTLAMSAAPRIRVSPSIDVLRCPCCGSLVLDDFLGWKGSGVVFKGSVDEILDYIQKTFPQVSQEIITAVRAIAAEKAIKTPNRPPKPTL